jgi:hypothetical protein
MTTSCNDLAIDDLLGDPVTRAVMKADRVDPSELEAMLRASSSRTARQAGRSNGDTLDAERVPFDRNAVGGVLRLIARGRGEASRCVAARSSTRSERCGVSLPW